MKKTQAYRLLTIGLFVAAIVTGTISVFLGSNVQEAEAILPNPLGNDRYEFVGIEYAANSECGLMVAQYVLTPPYSLDKVAPFMKFSQGDCDPENLPQWSECPKWVNQDLGLCEFVIPNN